MRSLLAIALTTALCAACGGSTPTGGCADPQLIDDMEDNDRFICASGGRHGDWVMRDDGTSTNISPRGEFMQSKIPGGRGASRHAAHMTGFGFTTWGAAMGFSLNGEGDATQAYDASATGGVRFWMKSDVPVSVEFPIPETLSIGTAARCVDDAATWNCDNHFYFRITAPPPNEWVEYDVPYSAAVQRRSKVDTEGNPILGSAIWDASALVGVRFAVDTSETFDVWVDDVRLYSCEGTACVPTCTDPGLPVPCAATDTFPATCLAAGMTCSKDLSSVLPGIWGSAADDVWAAGGGGTILHWNGAVWSAIPSGTTELLFAVWGSAPDDVWIVGTRGTILHWNGTTWSPVPSGTTGALGSIWGSGPGDVWAVGFEGTIVHWDGAAWSPVASPTSYNLYRVWGAGLTDVWATGASQTSGAGIIVHWDGSAWSPRGDTPAVQGLWGSGSSDVWAVGLEGAIRHWNGTVWSAVPSGTTARLIAVSGSGPNDVWAVGEQGAIVHWNGTTWSAVLSGTSVALSGVWARMPNDAWIGGAQGTILHWDGSAWSLVPVEVQ